MFWKKFHQLDNNGIKKDESETSGDTEILQSYDDRMINKAKGRKLMEKNLFWDKKKLVK